MSFVCYQIDLAVKNLFICFHKDAHLQLGRLQKQGLDDLLGIYNQGHNQRVFLPELNAARRRPGWQSSLFTSKHA